MKTVLTTLSLTALFLASTLAINKTKPVTKTIKAHKTSVAVALIRNLEYDNAQPLIRDKYFSDLDALAETVKKENYTLTIRGHADSVGKYKYNWVLSDKRALSVKDYLLSKGVKEDKIVTTPFGSTVPIASNKTPEGRQRNRRVEISIK
jgi:outer membrane protein OmpA-like peptidoglycan-associated protein